jgi:putative thiamine transport system permease protein
MLRRPILIASAIGFSVSCGMYLPSLYAGGGRIPTLITEAVTLSSSGDRRLIGIFAMLQTLLPLTAYAVAVIAPDPSPRKGRWISSQSHRHVL